MYLGKRRMQLDECALAIHSLSVAIADGKPAKAAISSLP